MATSKSQSVMDSKCKAKKPKGQNVTVVVRCRPKNDLEISLKSPNVVEIHSDRKEVAVVSDLTSGHCLHKRSFVFDRVFDHRASQLDVYKSVVCPIVDEVLEGYSCTIFAYGQTGTGKTYTMEGCRTSERYHYAWDQDPLSGVIPRSIHQLFEMLERNQNILEFSVSVSFLEIYNEELYDLLGAPFEQQRLRLFEDSARKGTCVVQGLEELIVHNKVEVYSILERGSQRRQTAATLLNAHSSRSHTVFSVTVNMKEANMQGEDILKTGRLYLVDLAGSENIGRSGAVDRRAREAGTINQSLLTLGRVIFALVEKTKHVPYRESKLTRLLQDSLGGRSKTVIIATISPSAYSLEETLSTLEYAQRAKRIKNRPEVNKLNKKGLIKEYTETIDKLNKDLQAAREKNGIYLSQDTYGNMQNTLLIQKDQIIELEDSIAAVRQQLERVENMFQENQAKLESHQHELKRAKKWLSWVRDELHSAQNHLKQKGVQIKEKEIINQELAIQQEKLYGEAVELFRVATEEAENVRSLNKKIVHLREAGLQNKKSTYNFSSYLKRSFSNLVNALDESKKAKNDLYIQSSDQAKILSKEINGLTSAFNTETDKLLQSNCKNVEDIKNSTDSFIENLAKRGKEFSDEMATSCDSHIQCSQNISSFLNDIIQQSIDFSNHLTERIQSLQSKADDVFSLQKTEILSHCNTIKQNLKDSITYVTSNNEVALIDSIKNDNQTHQDLFARQIQDFQNSILELINKKSQDLISSAKCYNDKISNQLEDIKSHCFEKSVKSNEFLTEIDQDISTLTNIIDLTFNDALGNVKNYVEAALASLSSYSSEIKTFTLSINDQVAILLKGTESFQKLSGDYSQQNSHDFTVFLSQIDQLITNLHHKLSHFKNESNNVLNLHSNSSNNFVNSILTLFSQHNKLSEDNRIYTIEVLNSIISKYKADVLSNPFPEKPSGDTPRPRAIESINSVSVPRSTVDIASSVRFQEFANHNTPTPVKRRTALLQLKSLNEDDQLPSFSIDVTDTSKIKDKENLPECE